ncbi:MAG TPA: L(+)-tartrate dehydratase subunit alpha [Sutterella sp.]|nr:L(+)-tartrate dehydratase subunit alpha [Sutterella sp.]
MEHAEAKLRLTEVMTQLTAYFGKHLPDDVLKRLTELKTEQKSELSSLVYDTMFRDLALADDRDVPLCQDTGVIQYFIECGADFPYLGDLPQVLTIATREATKKAPLRHNAVEIFDEKNTGTNTGYRIPWLDWDIVEGDACTIHCYMAGGGCSLPGVAKVLMPVEGYEGILRFIFDMVTERGINACPPLLLGVGIAGSAEVASRLSKKALMRQIGTHNPNPKGADFERLIEEGLNELNIGPQGLTGTHSVMAVHVEQAARHPSCLAVGLSTGCWAHRRATIRFASDLSYEVLTHKGAKL